MVLLHACAKQYIDKIWRLVIQYLYTKEMLPVGSKSV